MKKIILQHWDRGQDGLPDWAVKAQSTIKQYAKNINADYSLIEGFPVKQFSSDPKPVGQKLTFLFEKYDEYDKTLLLDIDMVATNYVDDIFQYEGIGRLHKKAMSHINASKNGREWPGMYTQGAIAFFGNCLLFTREERIALRKGFPSKELLDKNKSKYFPHRPPNDEVVLSYCIHHTGALKNKKTLELDHSRFCDLPEEAHPNATLIHYCGNRKNNI
jgi:hypothetical protein